MSTVDCIELWGNPLRADRKEGEHRVPYDNSQRAVAAASTRAQVLAAAHELFLSQGFAAHDDPLGRRVRRRLPGDDLQVVRQQGRAAQGGVRRGARRRRRRGAAGSATRGARRPGGDHPGHLRPGLRRARRASSPCAPTRCCGCCSAPAAVTGRWTSSPRRPTASDWSAADTGSATGRPRDGCATTSPSTAPPRSSGP